MDEGKVSIDAATRLARLPHDEQREIVAQPVEAIRERAREVKGAPRKVSGAGSKFSRSGIATMTLPKSVKQAASAIMREWGSVGLVEDLIEELQAKVKEARSRAILHDLSGQGAAGSRN